MTPDEKMTAFLKEQFEAAKPKIVHELATLSINHHVNVAFYRSGNVKIRTVKNGKDARTWGCITSVILEDGMDVDSRVNYAIESRMYRV